MNEWILAATFIFAGFLIWSMAFFLAEKRNWITYSIVGGIPILIGVLLFFQKQYWISGGLFLSVALFFVIVTLSFEFEPRVEKKEGPWAGFVGKTGVCSTPLDPRGKIRIDGQEIPATTEGFALPEGEEVEVIRSGARIVVVESKKSRTT